MNPLSEVRVSGNGGPDSSNENVMCDISGDEEDYNYSAAGLTGASSNHLETGDVFPSKHGSYYDLPAAKISELMKNYSLQGASTTSIFRVVNKIMDDNIERKSGDIPQSVASFLKLAVQEIEQRASKQVENLRKQSSLYKSREERYQTKIRALETLSAGTTEENEVLMNQLQQIKIEKNRSEEGKKLKEQDIIRLKRERSEYKIQVSSLMRDMELAKKTYERNCLQLEVQYKEIKSELEKRIMELECLLSDSRKQVKELEDFSETKFLRWKRKEHGYTDFIDSHLRSLQELKMTSESIKQEVIDSKKIYGQEFNHFELELKGMVYAAQNYNTVLAENRKLYNEVQDLKGNIRVYCRIRPFLPGQSQDQTTLDYIDENGELVIVNPNPLKQGKDAHRLFKFNKVFGPAATQEAVFRDTQPLIRSVLDGYNVCIFAYGQTGSGKTYTMTGPSLSSFEDWGINYRALNDLFNISHSRKSSIAYELGVQMIEIYNEQVRDLLSNESSQKRLGIWNTTQPNGLAVPDASMHPVKSSADVVQLMDIGLKNRAVGATALNERSSRSHSVLTVHVRGTELDTSTVLRGCLHLIDLAGSERVDRSEATGDRLREAQHINKSLSALGDVISALAQKSSHVPYRNSKLTQLLQHSLGGQAKTLMFVQLNPDVESYSETLGTLKFAERVSGVELGAARSNKESRGVRELMEQVAFLKDTITKKDDEIRRSRQLRTNLNGDRRSISSPRFGSASPRRLSVGAPRPSRRVSGDKSSLLYRKAVSDFDTCSEYSDKLSEAGSQQSMYDFRHHKEFFQHSRLAIVDVGHNYAEEVKSRFVATDAERNLNEDMDILGFGDDSEERLSDISDGVLSMGTETDGSVCSIVEYTLFPEIAKPPETTETAKIPGKLPKPPQKQAQTGSSRSPLNKSSSRVSVTKQPNIGSSSATKSTKRGNNQKPKA